MARWVLTAATCRLCVLPTWRPGTRTTPHRPASMRPPGVAGRDGIGPRRAARWFAAADARPAGARPVHLQLRRVEHERDDHRHQRGPGHDGAGRADRHHGLPVGDGGADDPRRQADRQVGTQAVLHARTDRVRDRRLVERVVAGSRSAARRQLDPRRRRHGVADPSGLHPHDDAVRRHHVAGPSVRA